MRRLFSYFVRPIRRIPFLIDELDRQLFSRSSLSSLPSWILINATNFSTGKAWKFFSDRAGDYLIGATKRTDRIRVAEDVAASAAYPILTDPFMFRTRWEELRMDLLDDRWGRPKGPSDGEDDMVRRREKCLATC